MAREFGELTELGGFKVGLMEQPLWSDAVPGFMALWELGGVGLGVRELVGSTLKWSELVGSRMGWEELEGSRMSQKRHGVSRPGLRKFGCERGMSGTPGFDEEMSAVADLPKCMVFGGSRLRSIMQSSR